MNQYNELKNQDIQNTSEPSFDVIVSICPKCNGTGKLKAMQLGINNFGQTQRTDDLTVKCDYCLGLGVLMNPKF